METEAHGNGTPRIVTRIRSCRPASFVNVIADMPISISRDSFISPKLQGDSLIVTSTGVTAAARDGPIIAPDYVRSWRASDRQLRARQSSDAIRTRLVPLPHLDRVN